MNQYHSALEKIEDPEDALACKKAVLEEKNYDIEEIDEFLKIEENKDNNEDEDFFINFDLLPKIYKYGLQMIRFLNEEDTAERSEPEEQEREESADESNKKEIIEDSDFVINELLNKEKQESEENNIILVILL